MKTFFSSLFAPFLPNTRMPADKKTYSKTCFSNPPKMEIFFQNLLFAINQRYKKQIIQYFKILQKKIRAADMRENIVSCKKLLESCFREL